jgi:hypothetical protein
MGNLASDAKLLRTARFLTNVRLSNRPNPNRETKFWDQYHSREDLPEKLRKGDGVILQDHRNSRVF